MKPDASVQADEEKNSPLAEIHLYSHKEKDSQAEFLFKSLTKAARTVSRPNGGGDEVRIGEYYTCTQSFNAAEESYHCVMRIKDLSKGEVFKSEF